MELVYGGCTPGVLVQFGTQDNIILKEVTKIELVHAKLSTIL
jgi:hypothetical protein